MNSDLIISRQIIEDLESAFLEIQQARTPFQLRNFVIGQHGTEPQQYAQCVLELQIKYDAIRRARLERKKLELERQSLLEKGDPVSSIDADLKTLDIEAIDRAALGALREFKCLYEIWKAFPHKYTRGELDAAQEEYWTKRLTWQANADLQATGRVSVGTQEALRMIGRSATPELDHVREVEKKYLETGDLKILVAVPTEEKATNGLPCLADLVWPAGVQIKMFNVWGRSTADAYNEAVRELLQDNADFLFTVEDDTFPSPDALNRLLGHFRGNGTKQIIGAWYPRRNALMEGAPIVIKAGKRGALEPDDDVHKVHTIPMGCTLFPAQVFLATEFPWFAKTEHLTQDSFFSQKAREAGYRLLCDTSIRCRHVDRLTGEIYERQSAGGSA